nr:hypothetical protein [Tanacetum cinerariifolium]
MTLVIPSSGFVPNHPSPASFVPPSRHEWDLVFQPVFDVFFSPPASVISLVHVEEAPTPVKSTSSPSLTTVDQDAPSPSTSQTTSQSQSQTIPLSAEEESHDLEVAYMSNDPFFGIPIPKPVLKNAHPIITKKFMNEIGKLRAISVHVLGAFGVQIPQDDLDNLQSIKEEEDGKTKVSDP